MKLISLVILGTAWAALAATEEKTNRVFSVRPGGTVVVDVDFGSIEVTTNGAGGVMLEDAAGTVRPGGTEAPANGAATVTVEVWRRVGRRSTAAEEAFLKDHPIQFSQDGDTVTIRSHGKSRFNGSWSLFGSNRTEAKYTVKVPARFSARLTTAGGSIAASGLAGEVKAQTSGGSLRFAGLHGPLDGQTSGGSIRVTDCDGTMKVETSGGSIELAGGSGTFKGDTSGGSVRVKGFHGPARVESSGGGITVEEVAGRVEGSTSGGSVHAVLLSPLPGAVKLSTSGGGITVRVARNAAFDLDAETSAGGVRSDLPVAIAGKPEHSRLKGPVNGGGQPVVLRTSGGSIHVQGL